uniref:Uncharacterized protein n=1 Tax=Aegilops tauschii subsp. strangulata TaxID=200361 RepID=A0A453KCN9_AEGTS
QRKKKNCLKPKMEVGLNCCSSSLRTTPFSSADPSFHSD